MSDTTRVDIQVAGISYPINCKPTEVEKLQQVASQINQRLKEIKQAAGNLSQEKLLVLCCLSLCDELTIAKQDEAQLQQSRRLISQMITDAKQALG